jgi:DNA invertase Pin-like site-specific DNA recombinase
MKDMETNTAAIYLRKSTEDEGKSVAAQERQLRTKAEQLGIAAVLFLTFELVEFRDLWF